MKGAILNFDAYTIRVFLHVLGASVWVGGQIVLAALVPTVRQFGGENTKKVANAFNRVAWPFFALTVITGIWHVFAIDLSVVLEHLALFRRSRQRCTHVSATWPPAVKRCER